MKPVNQVLFHPLYSLLLSASDDGSIKIWDAEAGICQSCFPGHNTWVDTIDVSRCGRYIVAGDRNSKTIELYSMKGHVHTYQGHINGNNCAVISPCSRFIVSAGNHFNDFILTWVNWKMLRDDGPLEDGGDWATKQYAQCNFEGASIQNNLRNAFRG